MSFKANNPVFFPYIGIYALDVFVLRLVYIFLQTCWLVVEEIHINFYVFMRVRVCVFECVAAFTFHLFTEHLSLIH